MNWLEQMQHAAALSAGSAHHETLYCNEEEDGHSDDPWSSCSESVAKDGMLAPCLVPLLHQDTLVPYSRSPVQSNPARENFQDPVPEEFSVEPFVQSHSMFG